MSDAPTTPPSPETVNAALIGCTDGLGKYPLRIEVRPLLVSAMEGRGPGSIFIMVSEGQSRTEAEISLWHEIVHVLMHAGGAPAPKTAAELTALEQQVEAIAQKLAAVCPEIVELCGVQTHFPNEKGQP